MPAETEVQAGGSETKAFNAASLEEHLRQFAESKKSKAVAMGKEVVCIEKNKEILEYRGNQFFRTIG